MIKWENRRSNDAGGHYRSQDAKGHLSVSLALLRILMSVISEHRLWCACVRVACVFNFLFARVIENILRRAVHRVQSKPPVVAYLYIKYFKSDNKISAYCRY